MATKIDIILQALEELRISGLTTDPTPEDISSALMRLDAMVESWKQFDLCLGYNGPEDEYGSDPNQESGLGSRDILAVVLNLSVQLAPSYGKALSPETRSGAKLAYEGLFSATPVQREGTPYQPKGSGTRGRYWYGGTKLCIPTYQNLIKNSPTDCSTLNIKTGQTKIYTLDLNDQITEGNTVGSYTYSTTGGITVDSISEADGVFTVELTGGRVVASTLKITITMNPDGEVNPVTTFVNVTRT